MSATKYTFDQLYDLAWAHATDIKGGLDAHETIAELLVFQWIDHPSEIPGADGRACERNQDHYDAWKEGKAYGYNTDTFSWGWEHRGEGR